MISIYNYLMSYIWFLGSFII